MGTTTTRVDPEDVAKAEILAEGGIDDLDGHGDEGPALAADVGLGAAGADVVVVGQIDIEAQLLGDGAERRAVVAEGLAVPRVRAVHGPDLEPRRHVPQHVLAQQVRRRVRLVPPVLVVRHREGELPVPEVVGRRGPVVQPLEEVPPREEPLVEGPHQLWVGGLEGEGA